MRSKVARILITLAVIGIIISLSACNYPISGSVCKSADIKFSFVVQGLSSQAAATNGSRLLLPTAKTLTVTLTPLAENLSTADSKSAPIPDGITKATIPVSFPGKIVGKYSIKAEAVNDAGVVLFFGVGDIDLAKSPSLTLYMLPVAHTSDGKFVPLESGKVLSVSVPAETSVTYRIPPEAQLAPSDNAMHLYIEKDDALAVFMQNTDGTPVSGGVFASTGDVYVTLHNPGAAASPATIYLNISQAVVTVSLNNPSQPVISASGQAVTLNKTVPEAMTVVVSTTGLSAFDWWLDGVSLATGNGSDSVTISSDTLSLGLHNLSLFFTDSLGVSHSVSLLDFNVVAQ